MKNMIHFIPLCFLGILAMVGFSGCGDAGGEAKTVAPVAIHIIDMTSIGSGGSGDQMYESDVCEDTDCDNICDTIYADVMQITLEIVPLNPEEEVDTSQYMDVILTGYEVKYERRDTGVDVPKTFTGNFTYYCPVEDETDITLEFCRADQKTMPPLSYLAQFGYEPDTGLMQIHTTCTITVWGETVAGKEIVSDPIRFTVTFAEYSDCN